MAKKNKSFLSRLFSGKKEERRYQAAAKTKRLSSWFAPSTSANTEIFSSLEILRNRARDLRRNNPLAAKGIMVISSNVVGGGIKTKFDGAGAEKIQEAWNKWAESTECDFNEQLNFYGLQKTVMEGVVESGEILARKRVSRNFDFPMQVQLLESDFIAQEVAAPDKDGNFINNGIEFDKDGRVQSYHLYETHPGDWSTIGFGKNGLMKGIATNSISKEELYHTFRPDRPGQVRGITWLAPSVIRLRDVDEFLDATIMKQKVAACFAGFVVNQSVEVDDLHDLEDTDVMERIEPGIIESLPAGKDIKFANPPSMEDFKEFNSVMVHSIASGLGITYESLTGDLSEVNFSSGRMGWIEMGRNIDSWRQHVMINMFIERVVKDFIKTYELTNNVNLKNISWRHISPRREMIDPSKEITGIIKSVRSGFTSLSEEITAMGRDPDKIFAQIEKDNKVLDDKKIILDSDPRNVTFAGILQTENEVSNEDN